MNGSTFREATKSEIDELSETNVFTLNTLKRIKYNTHYMSCWHTVLKLNPEEYDSREAHWYHPPFTFPCRGSGIFHYLAILDVLRFWYGLINAKHYLQNLIKRDAFVECWLLNIPNASQNWHSSCQQKKTRKMSKVGKPCIIIYTQIER